MSRHHISVCVCTYRRPDWLRRLLRALQQQQTGDQFAYSIVVADNDATGSGREIVAEVAGPSAVPIHYCVEPVKNIALARNRAIAAATGDWIAFIDDDEIPIPDWLLHLHKACIVHRAQGALGPVRPKYEQTPPEWVIKGGFYDRPEYETGFVMPWLKSRTGNLLFRREILPVGGPAFAPEFGTGGEDQDFFRRMMEGGHRFVWCNEAVVYETVPPIRWDKKVMIQRALLRGRNTLKHVKGLTWGKNILTSVLAVPAYILLLPFFALAGTHLYMRYLVRLFDHLGRLLAAVGLNRVRERVG